MQNVVIQKNLQEKRGPQTDKHKPQSPFTGQFFLDDEVIYALPSLSLILVRF